MSVSIVGMGVKVVKGRVWYWGGDNYKWSICMLGVNLLFVGDDPVFTKRGA